MATSKSKAIEERAGQGLKERNYASGPGSEIQGEALTVPIGNVRPNGYNYNAQSPAVFNKLVESMRRFGFTLPIIVRELAKGKFEIIDGEHRWRGAKELAMPEVRVINLGKVTDERAKQLTIILNELGGSPDQVRLAELLRDINTDVTFDELAKVMPYSDKELNALIDAVDFSFASLSDEDTRPKVDDKPASLPPIPDEELGADGEEEEVRAGGKSISSATQKASRIVLHVPPAEAKDLEMKLMQIDDDPLVAIQKAVDAYLTTKNAVEAVHEKAKTKDRVKTQKEAIKV